MKWQSPGLGKSGLCFMFYNILEKEGASIFDTPSRYESRVSQVSDAIVSYIYSSLLLTYNGIGRLPELVRRGEPVYLSVASPLTVHLSDSEALS